MKQEAWKRRDQPNMRIVWYEDLKKDLIQAIREMSKFLGYHLTELKILTLVKSKEHFFHAIKCQVFSFFNNFRCSNL